MLLNVELVGLEPLHPNRFPEFRENFKLEEDCDGGGVNIVVAQLPRHRTINGTYEEQADVASAASRFFKVRWLSTWRPTFQWKGMRRETLLIKA